jgi:hypothetical protein
MDQVAATPQSENGNGSPAGSIPPRVPGQGLQKRIDKLVRQRYELQADLERALTLIERYRQALRAARSVNHG